MSYIENGANILTLSDLEISEIVRNKAIESIVHYCRSHGPSKFQILDLIIPVERRIRSIVGGLEGSMGTSFWEPITKELAVKRGFQLMSEKLLMPSDPHHIIRQTLSTTIDRREGVNPITAADAKKIIEQICKKNPLQRSELTTPPKGNGVDIWIYDPNEKIHYLFDIKTVQPNLGDYRKYLKQILSWYAFFYCTKKDEIAEARMVFPYNPYESNFWENTMGGGRPLSSELEAWVADEFWSFITGNENAMEIIRKSLKEAGKDRTLRSALDALFHENSDS